MSSIAGFIPLGGPPAGEDLLARLAAPLAAVSPGGVTWRTLPGGAGLVHGPLPTGGVPEAPQPLTIDGRLWTVADARIDVRGELAASLELPPAMANAPAAELILRALTRWGPGAPARLRGDFAFAAWDSERRELSCARDPFGLRPLYHARVPGGLVFASSIAAILAHPEVSRELDDEWIADFLVYGVSRDPVATVYRAVRQLPAGHRLLASEAGVRTERYWSLPERAEPLLLPGPADYAERFRELLDEAVADRTREGRVGILLSGGHDSTAVAASWRARHHRGGLRGFTVHHASLLPDQEARYSGEAARHLGMERDLLALDGFRPFEPLVDRPEPVDGPLLPIEDVQLRRAAAHSPVLLTGQGGDALLRETPSRLTRLVAAGRPFRAVAEAVQYLRWHRRLPRPGVRTWARRGVRASLAEVPAWLDAGLAERVGLAARLAAQAAADAAPDPHPLRPEARGDLGGSIWPMLGAAWHPGTTGVTVEVRHPLLDLRLVDFVLSVPPAQWYNDKGLLRIAMANRLPRSVLARPKTPVEGDYLQARLEAFGPEWLGGRRLSPAVTPWVDPARVPIVAGGLSSAGSSNLFSDLRPLALSLWLEHHRP